jgi:hypothetical protein
MRIEFLPAAAQELAEAAKHYEVQLPGLGTAFLIEVERRCALLTEPTVIGVKLDSIHRRLPLRRFPYALIFRCDGDVSRTTGRVFRRA